MDSFRLVRYEMSTGKPSCGGENILLQQRHNTAPGMVLVSKTTAGLAKVCRLCSLHALIAPTGWQQQYLPEGEEALVMGEGVWCEDSGKVLSFPRNPDIYYRSTVL